MDQMMLHAERIGCSQDAATPAMRLSRSTFDTAAPTQCPDPFRDALSLPCDGPNSCEAPLQMHDTVLTLPSSVLAHACRGINSTMLDVSVIRDARLFVGNARVLSDEEQQAEPEGDVQGLRAFDSNVPRNMIITQVIGVSLSGILPSTTLLQPIVFVLGRSALVTDAIWAQQRDCVYWMVGEQRWDTMGCTLVDSSNTTITCACTHMTNFAVLANFDGSTEAVGAEHALALDIITYIGLGISIPCFLAVMITYLVFRRIRTVPKTLLVRYSCGGVEGWGGVVSCQGASYR